MLPFDRPIVIWHCFAAWRLSSKWFYSKVYDCLLSHDTRQHSGPKHSVMYCEVYCKSVFAFIFWSLQMASIRGAIVMYVFGTFISYIQIHIITTTFLLILHKQTSPQTAMTTQFLHTTYDADTKMQRNDSMPHHYEFMLYSWSHSKTLAILTLQHASLCSIHK